MKVVTEKAIMPFIGDVENIKLLKIKECSEKAVITAKLPKAAKATVVKAAPKKEEPKPVARPAAKRPIGLTKRPAAAGGAKAAKPAAKKAVAAANVERELTEEEVDEQVAELVAPQILADMLDGNWKTRLNAAEQFLQAVGCMDKAELPAQVLVRAVCKKPGLKDGNFQVLKVKLDVVKIIAESPKFSRTSANVCLQVTFFLNKIENLFSVLRIDR